MNPDTVRTDRQRHAGWIVWSRPDCSLCDELVAELAEVLVPCGQAFQVRDVDDDPQSQRRFGLKIPVLTLDGHLVCQGRLDRAAVEKLLSR